MHSLLQFALTASHRVYHCDANTVPDLIKATLIVRTSFGFDNDIGLSFSFATFALPHVFPPDLGV